MRDKSEAWHLLFFNRETTRHVCLTVIQTAPRAHICFFALSYLFCTLTLQIWGICHYFKIYLWRTFLEWICCRAIVIWINHCEEKYPKQSKWKYPKTAWIRKRSEYESDFLSIENKAWKKFSPVQDLFVCDKPVMSKWLCINADLEMNMREIFTVMIYTLKQ